MNRWNPQDLPPPAPSCLDGKPRREYTEADAADTEAWDGTRERQDVYEEEPLEEMPYTPPCWRSLAESQGAGEPLPRWWALVDRYWPLTVVVSVSAVIASQVVRWLPAVYLAGLAMLALWAALVLGMIQMAVSSETSAARRRYRGERR